MNDATQTTSRQVWDFDVRADIYYSGDVTLMLSSYRIERRASTRHKWRSEPEDTYRRLDPRGARIKVDAVHIPEFIEAAAREELAKRVVMKKEDK